MVRRIRSNEEFPTVDLVATRGWSYALYIVGDIHGDLTSARGVIQNFIKVRKGIRNNKKIELRLLFLGDYIDRAPKDIKNGGFLSLLYLLSAKILYPEEIILLRGNHEGIDLLTFSPYELPLELHDIFGDDMSEEVHSHISGIFKYLPLFLRTDNGLIATHAGFPKDIPIDEIEIDDRDEILRALWGDPVESKTYRGEISDKTQFTEKDLKTFLKMNGGYILVRGHDYRTMGYSMYKGKMITIHSSRKYKERGAGGIHVLRAMIHPGAKIRSTSDLKFMHLEGAKYVNKKTSRWK
jgi:hypothetical protein